MDWLLLDISNDPTTKWLLIVAVGLTIFYAVMRPLRKKKDPLEATSSRPGLASQRGVERDMNNLLVELSEMARQLTAQLDTRTIKLETLLKEADERIAALKEVNRHAVQSNGDGAAPDAAAAPPEPLAPKIDPRHQEIYELFDQNLSLQEIANRLSRPRGEIDLILKLRRKSEV